MAQPDFNLYPTFTNSMGSGTMSYYYRDGRVYINNSENKDELKSIETGNATLQRRATQIKAAGTSMSTFTTSLGNTITNLDFNDELWLNHNYVNNINWDSRTPASVENSWWYDVDKHREYRVWLHVRYTNSGVISGNTSYDWRVVNAFVEYNSVTQDDTAGTFRFTSTPEDSVTVTGTLQFESSNRTWPTMSAVLYRGTPGSLPGSVLATETFMSTTAVDEEVEVSIELDPAQISVNDTITLAAEVNGTSGQITAIAAPLRVTSYELSVEGDQGEYTPGGPVDFGGLGESLDLSDDCNPLLNNVGGYRANEKLQIVEFSESELGEGALTPSNLDEIRSGSAQKASVPESYYTSAAIRRNRYDGSKFTRTQFNTNEHSDDGHLTLTGRSLGEIGIYNSENSVNDDLTLYNERGVDILDTHLGYFNQIIDPYPVLNNKTAYFVKYLINSQGVVQDPSLSELGNLNFTNTFKIKDINNQPAEYLPSIPNDVNRQELLELRTTSSLFRIGEYPHPVLWSQTSATTYTENLPLTGSQDFYSNFEGDTDSYTNIAFNTSDNTVTPTHPIQVSPTTHYAIPRTIFRPTGINYLGADNENIFTGDSISIPTTPLTDSYTLNGTFTFYTTPLPTRRVRNRGVYRWWPTSNNRVAYSTMEILRNGSNITPNSVSLTAYHEQVDDSGNVTNLNSTTITLGRDYRNGVIFRRTNQGYQYALTSDISYVDDLFGYVNGHHDVRDGHRYRFVFRYTISSNQIRPGDNFQFAFSSDRPSNPNDTGGNDGRTGDGSDWRRSLFPQLPASNPSRATLDITLLGTQTAATEEINTVAAPYWGTTGVAANQLELVSSHLNSRYAANFFQGNLPYIPGSNPVFPASQEPSFIAFPGATDEFEILPGDEFRFENNENETYVVTQAIKPAGQNLVVTFDRNLTPALNTDFFLIRRYKRSENVIILNQQKPYSFPPSASSSPGILLPEYLSPELETDPDAVITNLIERNLI